MNYIKESLINYIFLLFVFCPFEIGLIQYYKRKAIRINNKFVIGYQCFICYLISVFTITGAAGIDNSVINNQKSINLLFYLENIFSFECIMNMILFIPLGVIIPLLWSHSRTLWIIITTGMGLSLLIELSQILNYRASDINDVLTNTIGTIIGYLIYKVFLSKIHDFELDDKDLVIKNNILIQIIIVCIIYFFIGSPILSIIHGF